MKIYTMRNHQRIVRTEKHMHDKPPPFSFSFIVQDDFLTDITKIEIFILYSILGNAYTKQTIPGHCKILYNNK